MNRETFTHVRASGAIETVYPDGSTRIDYPSTGYVGFPGETPELYTELAWQDRYTHPRGFDASRLAFRRISPRVVR